MKKIIKSWRWKRLTERECWTSFFEESSLLVILITTFYVSLLLAEKYNLLSDIGAGATIVYAIFWVLFIGTICIADNYFELKDVYQKKCRVYVYNEGVNGYKIIAKYADKEVCFRAKEYINPYKEYSDFCNENNFAVDTRIYNDCFIYKSIDSEIWKMVCASYDDNQDLGEKVSTQVFRPDTEHLNILQPYREGLVITIGASEFFWGDAVYIPKNARENLHREFEGKCMASDEADRYLFVKHKDNYTLYGFYLDFEDDVEPLVEAILADSVITCDGFHKYVFILENGTYKNIIRERNFCRKANGIFIQPLHTTGMMADITQYDETYKTRKSLLKCHISSMDFDEGDIIGHNSEGDVIISFDEKKDAVIE